MLHPSKTEYTALTARYDVIPVYREILADLETPVSVLQRYATRPNTFLLESMEGGEKWGRYSFVGVDPELLFEAEHGGGRTGELEALRGVYQGLRVADLPGLPRFCGGAVGFAGYESMCEFERMPLAKASPEGVRTRSRFVRADQLIVFDNVRNTLKIVVCTHVARFASPLDAYEDAERRIAAIILDLQKPSPVPVPLVDSPVAFESNLTPEAFRESVRKAKAYIYAGDVIQVVLSQRFSAASALSALTLYRALRMLNPSPYTFFIKIGDQTLVGSSPEVMVRLTGNRIEVRPIAGTRPRGETEQDDRQMADELLSDEKERAEHVMLVDLGRNDVGRVAEAGSVQVSEFMVIERYSHVMHLVSHVQGVLRKEFDAYDVLKATFPAGTLSGAPKIRAMEIIHELEPGPRGTYGGAVGYVGYNGSMDMAITIRTIDVSGGRVAVQSGAGIVYDSDPEREYQETCHKARGMIKAVEMAARGLEIG